MCYQALGDRAAARSDRPRHERVHRHPAGTAAGRLGPAAHAGSAAAGARTYEPKALVTHTTAGNIELLVRFYRLTGETKFLARIPEALEWLDRLTLPPGVAPPGRTHPTFVELGTNEPLYVHREGSNVFNGRYYVDKNPKRHHRPLQLVPAASTCRPAQAVRGRDEARRRRK